ncbi:PREDICTED: uncharacterized protein LOC104707665 [Camelina sativa]|uniref:Uncharacterized protein LOC104707665 n=1 Tax=Camelina sativa TaxID=90675 RepID=A0ABM1QC56_CAMSA|nr:PREDICTED: uncharacterized protein LOC104707665 [Camelina sativa]
MKKIFFGLLNKEKSVNKKEGIIKRPSNENVIFTDEVRRYPNNLDYLYLCSQGRNAVKDFDGVFEKMHLAISVNRNEALDSVLNDFKEGYLTLSCNDRNKLLLGLAKEYYVDDIQVEQLIDQYLIRLLEICPRNEMEPHDNLDALYSIERNLKYALRPDYDILFERLHKSSGGVKFLCTLEVDILSMLT